MQITTFDLSHDAEAPIYGICNLTLKTEVQVPVCNTSNIITDQFGYNVQHSHFATNFRHFKCCHPCTKKLILLHLHFLIPYNINKWDTEIIWKHVQIITCIYLYLLLLFSIEQSLKLHSNIII